MTDITTARKRDAAATLEDVAHAAGVSLATASRVLNGSVRKVAEPFRERVEAAALELGYTANLSAQAIARGTSNVVSLLVADIADPYFGQIAAGVSRGAAEEGLLLSIGVTGRDPAQELEQIRVLRGQKPRVVILATSRTGAELPDEFESEVRALRNAGASVLALGPGAGDIRSLHIDNRGGAWALGRAMRRRGYTRAVISAAPAGIRTSDDRVAGFTEGFEKSGGKVIAVHRGDFTREAGACAMSSAIERGELPPGTVLFAISDIIALGAMARARLAGRTIGSDIAVAGFDDIPAARDVTPALTTVRIPLERLGHDAVRKALADDVGDDSAAMVEVVLRESTPNR